MLRAQKSIGISLLIVLILSACQPLKLVADHTPIVPEPVGAESTNGTWNEIFVIGVENSSGSGFASGGFDQHQEFVCHIHVDCKVADIPAGLYEGDSPRAYRDEAPRLTIVFTLNRDYSEVMLHLARAGSETTAVSIDGGAPLLVTSEMLGSRDGGVMGSYDLPLGPLQAGSHSVTFSVQSDGIGNGGYAWDALSMYGR